MIDLSGKVAMVTGASRGIGAATARKLAEYGATVVLLARTRTDILDNVKSIEGAGGKADAIACDVTIYPDVQNSVDQCVSDHGSLDILVNNAGTIEPLARLIDSDPELWDRAVDTNIKGVYHGLRAALPVMEKQGSGVIVNMSSGAANSALEGWSHYCSTKSAAKKLTECAHAEVGDRGIRIVGLSPGTVATDMMAAIKESGINPVSRLDWSTHISPDWAAEAVAWLCTDAGAPYAGTDFSLKTDEGLKLVGLI